MKRVFMASSLALVVLSIPGLSSAGGKTVEISVVVPDPDKVSNCLAELSATPTMTERGVCLGRGLVGNHVVKVEGLDVMGTSDAMGTLTISVPQESSIRFIFPGDNTYEPTLGNEFYAVGSRALMGIPAHAMGKYSGATTSAIAAAASTTADALTQQGLCIVDVLRVHVPPDIQNAENVMLTVTESGYDIYAVGKFTATGPSNITKSNMSAAGRFALTKAGLIGDTTIHMQATASGLTFAPATCALRPGFVTFAPYGRT
jgi:hypothetical protein